MGDAVGAWADAMTARPHKPAIVKNTGFLIVQALRGNTRGPGDQDADAATLLQLSGTELNSVADSRDPREARTRRRSRSAELDWPG
jgi:hypothetical protein